MIKNYKNVNISDIFLVCKFHEILKKSPWKPGVSQKTLFIQPNQLTIKPQNKIEEKNQL